MPPPSDRPTPHAELDTREMLAARGAVHDADVAAFPVFTKKTRRRLTDAWVRYDNLLYDAGRASVVPAHEDTQVEASMSRVHDVPFIDTPLLAAKRAAFDYPTQVNLDALCAATLAEVPTHDDTDLLLDVWFQFALPRGGGDEKWHYYGGPRTLWDVAAVLEQRGALEEHPTMNWYRRTPTKEAAVTAPKPRSAPARPTGPPNRKNREGEQPAPRPVPPTPTRLPTAERTP